MNAVKRRSLDASVLRRRWTSSLVKATTSSDATAPSGPGSGVNRYWMKRSVSPCLHRWSNSTARPVAKASRAWGTHSPHHVSGVMPRSSMDLPRASARAIPR